MKKITPMEIAVLFVGAFLGAGFLSGQEILQFFAVFGSYGLVGMVLSIAAFVLLSLLVLTIAKETGITAFDAIILRKEIPWLRAGINGLFLFFLFDVVVAMIAGAGSLLKQLFGLPAPIGSALITVLILAVALAGLSGLLTAFNLVIPVLILAAVLIALLAFGRFPAAPIEAHPFVSGNPLLSNWFFSALSYISCNMVGVIPIFVPLAEHMEDKRTIRKGMALGAILLILIFVFILLPMIFYRPLVGQADLPMLALAFELGRSLGILYAVPLFCGMFTAALSGLYGVTARVQAMAPDLPMKRFTILVCILSYLGSLLGFKNLVAVVYPICGYVGLFALVGVLEHGLALRRKTQ